MNHIKLNKSVSGHVTQGKALSCNNIWIHLVSSFSTISISFAFNTPLNTNVDSVITSMQLLLSLHLMI